MAAMIKFLILMSQSSIFHILDHLQRMAVLFFVMWILLFVFIVPVLSPVTCCCHRDLRCT
jgi:hypothetical protein